MSNKKRRNRENRSETINLGLNKPGISKRTTASETDALNQSKSNMLSNLKKLPLWAAGLILVFVLGSLGATLKYLEDVAKQERASNQQNTNLLSKINPFAANPLPTATPAPTPQLSKEYIYAGSRVLAVEDVGATAAAPADLAVWRYSTGEWWLMGSNTSQAVTQSWGTTNDETVEGDYDGDGKTDFSVFRPNNGNWYIVYSSTGGTAQYPFGQTGDKPAQADYDGDGKTDAAVFRAGTWYIRRSSDSGVTTQQFGLSTDKPAAADYDGDGKVDIAVRRDGDSTFYVLRSSNSLLQTATFGQSGDIPVSGDYDGDGKADYALKSGNNWIIKQSSNNQTQIVPWQQAGDIKVPNDYDGDGKMDIAVWRDLNGRWYIRQSSKVGMSDELREVQWGISGDKPVASLYRR